MNDTHSYENSSFTRMIGNNYGKAHKNNKIEMCIVQVYTIFIEKYTTEVNMCIIHV